MESTQDQHDQNQTQEFDFDTWQAHEFKAASPFQVYLDEIAPRLIG
jgi:hypothetical protein